MARHIKTSAGLPRFPDGENNGRIFYVYAHTRSGTNGVFYIGKGKGSRALDKVGRNRHWTRVQKKNGRDVWLLSEMMPHECACTLEKILIHRLKPECNYSTGGESGGLGVKKSQETVEKHRQKMIGRKKTDAHRMAMMGREVSHETRKKISQALIGRKMPEEAKQKMRSKNLLTLKHKDHGEVTLTPWEFCNVYGINRSNIGLLEKGKRASVDGWFRPGCPPKTKAGRGNGMFDHKIYKFQHPDHGVKVSTRSQLKSEYGLLDSRLSDIINGKRKSHKGWIVCHAQG